MKQTMDLEKIFSISFAAAEKEAFFSAYNLYCSDVVCVLIFSLLAKIPLIEIIFSFLSSNIVLYALVGIILSILGFVKVIK